MSIRQKHTSKWFEGKEFREDGRVDFFFFFFFNLVPEPSTKLSR